MRHLLRFWRDHFAHFYESPIIVAGNQKSGTSAIAHLLADFGGLSKTIDIPPLWGWVAADIIRGKIDFASVASRHRSYFSTALIKEPNMIFFIDQVIEMFPKAKYVFVIRDPRDNTRSLLNRKNLPGHFEKLAQHLSDLSPLVNESVWGGEGENYIGVLAHRWNKAVDNYLRFQDHMILAKYEDFMADKCRFIADLAAQMNLSKKIDISDRVDIQYQPQGNREVSWEEFFGRKNLRCIERICGSRMMEFGYFYSQ